MEPNGFLKILHFHVWGQKRKKIYSDAFIFKYYTHLFIWCRLDFFDFLFWRQEPQIIVNLVLRK